MTLRNLWMAGGLALAVTALTACDNGPSAVETRDRSDQASTEAAVQPVTASVDAERATARSRGPARWTSNSRNTADQNIQRLFERNGAAFSAASPEDYVNKAHAFITAPPAGTETVRRGNGDTLYYHAASNTFLVATSDGTPRTMFKPDDGPAYWDQQKVRAASSG
ncbi:S-type pyocin family protein [Brevundimonas sp.]|uniref:S-type pyocin family protein n=1 Tax=Brevundimonas sp. TaxID=1871086 RepID=UPI003918C03C